MNPFTHLPARIAAFDGACYPTEMDLAMIVVFSRDIRFGARAIRALEDLDVVALVDEWHDLYRAIPATDLVVVVDTTTGSEPRQSVLVELVRQQSPEVPCLVITERDPDHVRRYCIAGVAGILWTSEIDRDLRRVAANAVSNSAFTRLATRVAEVGGFHPTLRSAISLAMRSTNPPRTVAELARDVSCHRSTLSGHWRRAFTDEPARDKHARTDYRLEDFLGWLTLLRVLQARATRRSWSAAARSFGVQPRWLGRSAVRLVGIPLRQLEKLPLSDLLNRLSVLFFRQLAEPKAANSDRAKLTTYEGQGPLGQPESA